MNEWIAQELLKKFKADHKSFYGRALNKKVAQRNLEFYRKTLKKDETYRSISSRNGKIEKLVCATEFNNPFVGHYINVFCFQIEPSGAQSAVFKEELESIEAFFSSKPKKTQIQVRVDEKKQISLLKKYGFEPAGQLLIAKTADGLKHLREKVKNNPLDWEIEPMAYDRDIQQVLTNEKRAHRNDSSSVIQQFTRRLDEEMKRHIKVFCQDKTAWVIREKGKVIATTGIGLRKDQPGVANMGFISIHPKYQGQGIASHLYHRCLSEMKARKCSVYSGFSSTQKVLSLGKKMKRKPVLLTFSRDRD